MHTLGTRTTLEGNGAGIQTLLNLPCTGQQKQDVNKALSPPEHREQCHDPTRPPPRLRVAIFYQHTATPGSSWGVSLRKHWASNPKLQERFSKVDGKLLQLELCSDPKTCTSALVWTRTTPTPITTWKISANLEYTKHLFPTPDFASPLDVKNHLFVKLANKKNTGFKLSITRMVFLICFEST